MNSEHNPIAVLISQLQQKWMKEVTPNDAIQWVRWIMKPEEARLYEGFLRLESTENGSIPDIPIVLLTPFQNSKNHSEHLLRNWLDQFEQDKTLKAQLERGTLEFNWDKAYFEKKVNSKDIDFDALLIEMLASFQKALPDNEQHLVLSLFPYTVQSPQDYLKWMDTLLTIGLPEKVRLMVFDHHPQNYFESLQLKYKETGKSLYVPIDLDSAMKKAALAGNPNDPELQFRECMIEMGNSTAKNNRKRFHIWGEKGIEVTQKSGNKASFATAHTIYAGMLFHFKEYDTIDKLLQKALTIAMQSLAAQDKTVQPIIVQTYGFMATSQRHQKNIAEATDLFCKQAVVAAEYGYGQQALAAYTNAYMMIKAKSTKRFEEIIEKAYIYGITLTPEELKASSMPQIAYEYYYFSNANKQKKIDSFMSQQEGKDWKEQLARQEEELKTSIST